MSTAERTDPKLWDKVKGEITRSDKGGKKGEWSARKAQMAVQEYKKRGGGYKGAKPKDNHLRQWTEEDWGTKSGKTSGDTGERYLPKKARENLSDAEYRRTTAKKRADTRKGKQFSGQPDDIARKTAPYRHAEGASADAPTKGELMDRAKEAGIEGRSRMSKAELERALAPRGEPVRGNGTSGGGAKADAPVHGATKKDLAQAATSLGIGRISSKTKGELAGEIRDAVKGEAGARLTKVDLQSLARTFAVDVRSSMTKADLQRAIASAA